MPRAARIVVPGLAHHVTQRGNNRQEVFRTESDCRRYLGLLGEAMQRHGVSLVAWCLMPNHVHLVVVPPDGSALARSMEAVHGRYAQEMLRRTSRSGHLWQGRYFSCPLDEIHLVAAVRYVERNPVRAGFVACAWLYPWSSAAAHVCGDRRGLVDRFAPLDDQIRDWRAFLAGDANDDLDSAIRRATASGRPAGREEFVGALEKDYGSVVRLRPAGRPRTVGLSQDSAVRSK